MNTKRFVALIAAVVGITLASPAFADWKTNYETAQQGLKDKDYRNAENAAVEALNEAEKFGESDDRRLATLELLADIYRETRQWAAAAGLLEQVMAVRKKAGTDQSPEAGYSYNRMGVIYMSMRDYDKAMAAYEASLAIKRKKYKANVASIAVVVTNLGELYRRKKDWPKAEELHKQAIADKEMELGPDHPTLVPSLNNLALVYRETKRYDEALVLLTRAKELGQKGENGGKNADVATAMHNTADVYQAQSKQPEAKAQYEAALALRKQVLGPQHPSVAETLNNYANTLLALNLGDEALKAYDEALEIRKLEFGATDPRSTQVMSNKAMALDRLKRKDEAAKLRDEVKQLELRRQNEQQ